MVKEYVGVYHDVDSDTYYTVWANEGMTHVTFTIEQFDKDGNITQSLGTDSFARHLTS